MWSDRFREILYPLLVISIVATLWVVGRAGEIEADSRLSLAPSPHWQALQARMHAQEAQASIAE